MQRMRVGVLRGGPSSEYDVSLKTGASVLRNLDEERYQPVDLFVDKAGVWHARGLPTNSRRALQSVDVVINAMHGEFGEDGTVQKILEAAGTPYTGTRAFSSALAMNKIGTRRMLEKLGVKMPRHMAISRGDDLSERSTYIFQTLSQPVVVKPAASGSSVGVAIVHGAPAIARALEEALEISDRALVEEYLSGREATCGVLERFRDQDIYVLPPIEIIPPKENTFFDYDAKYSGKTQEICPGNFSHETKQELAELSRQIHEALGLRHYSRSDFIVTPKRGIHFLEVNTLPGLTAESLYPKATGAVGCTFPQLLDHLIFLAQVRK